MIEDNQIRLYQFYQAVLERLEYMYPEFQEQSVGMLKVLHAFSDKPPLIKALVNRDLLAGVVLKKSSQEQQVEIAEEITSFLAEKKLHVRRSLTTYGTAVPLLAEYFGDRPILLGDHGGYFAKILPEISSELGSRLIGVTEHTLNGDFRHLRNEYYDIPFLSTARIDLKERSDKEISEAIAREIILHAKQNGKDFLSPNCHEKILLIGYGVMGLHTGNKLIELGCRAEIIVNDISDKRKAFAIQDGFSVIRDIKEFLPESDVIILATNVIRGLNPVLTEDDFALLKENVFVTSMTSLGDELNLPNLFGSGALRKIGKENQTGIYKGPNDQIIQFMLDGCPANTALTDGGSSISMSMVEAAGLAGGFYLTHCSAQGLKPEKSLPEEVVEMICGEWMRAFTIRSPQYSFQNFRPS